MSKDNNNSNYDTEIEKIIKAKMIKLQETAKKNAEISLIKEPLILNENNFKNTITKYPIVVVDFWASWCGPCRIISPIIEQLANEYNGKIVFGKVNVDENEYIARNLNIQSIPTLIVYKNGKPVDTLIGALPKTQIEIKLKEILEDKNNK